MSHFKVGEALCQWMEQEGCTQYVDCNRIPLPLIDGNINREGFVGERKLTKQRPN